MVSNTQQVASNQNKQVSVHVSHVGASRSTTMNRQGNIKDTSDTSPAESLININTGLSASQPASLQEINTNFNSNLNLASTASALQLQNRNSMMMPQVHNTRAEDMFQATQLTFAPAMGLDECGLWTADSRSIYVNIRSI